MHIKFGEHLIEQNAQNAAEKSLQHLITKQFFDEATSKDLCQVQKLISDEHNASANLIDAQPHSDNLISAPTEGNLINMHSNDIFLINESLHEPLLNVANKLLGRQRLNF